MESFTRFLLKIFPTNFETGDVGSIDLNICLAQASGIPLIGFRRESSALRFLSLLWGVSCLFLVTICYLLFEMYDLVFECKNLNEITQNACLSLTHLAGAYKAVNMFYRYNDVLLVLNEFRSMTRTYVKKEKQRLAFLRGEFETKGCLVIYTSIVCFTAFLAFIFLWSKSETVAGQIFPFRVKLPSWIPFEVQLLYMAASVTFAAMQVVTLDYLNVTMINQMRYQFITLNLAFEELTIREADEMNEKTIVELQIFEIKAKNKLRSIIEHHVQLISLHHKIEDIFRMTILVQFVTSLLIMALSGFQATVHSESANGAVLIYFYCGDIFCELFFYCWFGNELSEQSKTLSLSGFKSSWNHFGIPFKKSLLLLLINSQRPITFTAGGFINLSLPSFTGILSKVYSSIALLRQIYNNK